MNQIIVLMKKFVKLQALENSKNIERLRLF